MQKMAENEVFDHLAEFGWIDPSDFAHFVTIEWSLMI